MGKEKKRWDWAKGSEAEGSTEGRGGGVASLAGRALGKMDSYGSAGKRKGGKVEDGGGGGFHAEQGFRCRQK